MIVSSFSVVAKIAWIVGGSFLITQQFKRNVLFFGLFQILIFDSQVISAYFVKRYVKPSNLAKLINGGIGIMICAGLIAFLLSLFFPHFLLRLISALMLYCAGSSLIAPAQRLAIEACSQPMGTCIAVYSSFVSLFCGLGSVLVSTTYTGHLVWFGSLLLVVSSFIGFVRWLSLRIT